MCAFTFSHIRASQYAVALVARCLVQSPAGARFAWHLRQNTLVVLRETRIRSYFARASFSGFARSNLPVLSTRALVVKVAARHETIIKEITERGARLSLRAPLSSRNQTATVNYAVAIVDRRSLSVDTN